MHGAELFRRGGRVFLPESTVLQVLRLATCKVSKLAIYSNSNAQCKT